MILGRKWSCAALGPIPCKANTYGKIPALFNNLKFVPPGKVNPGVAFLVFTDEAQPARKAAKAQKATKARKSYDTPAAHATTLHELAKGMNAAFLLVKHVHLKQDRVRLPSDETIFELAGHGLSRVFDLLEQKHFLS